MHEDHVDAFEALLRGACAACGHERDVVHRVRFEAKARAAFAFAPRDEPPRCADHVAAGHIDLERVVGKVGVELRTRVIGKARERAVLLELGELWKPLRHRVKVVDVACAREHRRQRRDERGRQHERFVGQQRLVERDLQLSAVAWDELLFGAREHVLVPHAQAR